MNEGLLTVKDFILPLANLFSLVMIMHKENILKGSQSFKHSCAVTSQYAYVDLEVKRNFKFFTTVQQNKRQNTVHFFYITKKKNN